MTHGPTNTKWLKSYRSSLSLSIIQKDFLIGTLLGDGHIQPSRSGLLARLQVRHAVRFVDYVNWQYVFWKDWTLKGPTFDSYNGSVVIRSIFHPELVFWRNLFYSDKIKVVPSNIKKLLVKPFSLAVWFMDDGNGSKEDTHLRLSTYAFGLSGNQVLQYCLDKNFNLEARIYHDSKGSYLWFPKSSAFRLYELIKPYILPCMEYKFQKLITSRPLTP